MSRARGRSAAYVQAGASDAERFLTYAGMRGGSACWEWLGAYSHGIPHMKVPGIDTCSPRRFAWWFFHGGIPQGMNPVCRHGNSACLRPDHLILRPQGRRPRLDSVDTA